MAFKYHPTQNNLYNERLLSINHTLGLESYQEALNHN